MPPPRVLLRYRWALGIFIAGLIASGLTAFPLAAELDWLTAARGLRDVTPATAPAGLDHWLVTLRDGLRATDAQYPWLAYGTDWLAFAHLVLAVFFIGPWRDPVRNVWVIQAGLIACALVIPLALIAGEIRGIPFYWRLLDCSFGLLGAVPLGYCWTLTHKLPHEAV